MGTIGMHGILVAAVVAQVGTAATRLVLILRARKEDLPKIAQAFRRRK